MTHGQHTLSFGGEASRENDAQQTTLNDYGVFQFTAHTNTANRSSAAITDFLFGSPNTMGQDVPVYANANYFNYGVFFQDDWRVRPSLTLNLGIRYDIQTTPTDTQLMTINFVPSPHSTIDPIRPFRSSTIPRIRSLLSNRRPLSRWTRTSAGQRLTRSTSGCSSS